MCPSPVKLVKLILPIDSQYNLVQPEPQFIKIPFSVELQIYGTLCRVKCFLRATTCSSSKNEFTTIFPLHPTLLTVPLRYDRLVLCEWNLLKKKFTDLAPYASILCIENTLYNFYLIQFRYACIIHARYDN